MPSIHKIPSNKTCPKCDKYDKYNMKIIKYGHRTTNLGKTQIYLCKKCNFHFSINPLKRHNYPPFIILNTISTYNLGYTVSQTNKIINRKFKTKIPISTLNTWLKRYESDLSFIRLRKNYDIAHFGINLPEGHPSGS